MRGSRSSAHGGDPRVFDPGFYLSEYPEIATSGLEPQEHFSTRGWREGKDPSPLFSTSAYLELHPDIRAAGMNPFTHFVHFGYAEGRRFLMSRPRREELARRLDVLLASETPAQGSDSDPVALLLGSAWFVAGHVARLTGLSGSRRDLVAAWLARDPADRCSPSPDFDPAYYRDHAGVPPDADAFLDFLTRGLGEGRYPNAFCARADIRTIRAGGGIDAEFYAASLPGPPRHADPVTDYVLDGRFRGGQPMPGFDGEFIRRVDMGPSGIVAAPFAHFLRFRSRPWMRTSLDALTPDYCAVALSDLFEPAWYARAARIDATRVDPVLHYLLRGVRMGLATSPGFDTGHYLAANPDLRDMPMNPLVHYERHGRAEGRSALPEARSVVPEREARRGKAPLRPGRPGALIVSHEASLSGAPIVALNLARELSLTHDVILWLGKAGVLSPDFEEVATFLIDGFPPDDEAADLLSRLLADRPVEVALVNSALSGVAIPALRRAGLPIVFLVHDFATYVYPRGLLSRLVLHSHVTVFPAAIVRDAVIAELAALGVADPPNHLRIAHQGHNGTAAVKAPEPAALARLRLRLGLPESGPRPRVLFGGGWVQPRKGVDLFIQTADRLVREGRHDWRFVWIGGNYKPDEDMMVSVYLADHVEKAGLSSRFHFFDEEPDLEPFWAVTDIFFLSSRLDPYPNIALDALARRIPVVCFGQATGIADLAADFPDLVRVAAFSDPKSAADEIDRLAEEAETVRDAFVVRGEALGRELSFATYVDRLGDFAAEARARAEAERRIAEGFARRPVPEIARALSGLPAWVRLPGLGTPDRMRMVLSAFLVAGGPAPALASEPGDPLEAPTAAHPLLRPGPHPAPAPDDAPLWSLHVHGAGAAERLRAAGLAPDVALIATAGPKEEEPGALPARDAFAGLLRAAQVAETPFVAHFGEGEQAAAATLAAFETCPDLPAWSGVAAAFRVPGRQDLPLAALRRLDAAGIARPDLPVPPGFAALFAREPLAAFLDETEERFAALSAGLPPRAATALRAALFARWCEDRGLAFLALPEPAAASAEDLPPPPEAADWSPPDDADAILKPVTDTPAAPPPVLPPDPVPAPLPRKGWLARLFG